MKKSNLKDLSVGEIETQRDELTKKLSDLRFNRVMGHLENPLEIRTVRRQIARLNTLIHEHNLGIRKG